jgi:hypothetical protein
MAYIVNTITDDYEDIDSALQRIERAARALRWITQWGNCELPCQQGADAHDPPDEVVTAQLEVYNSNLAQCNPLDVILP